MHEFPIIIFAALLTFVFGLWLLFEYAWSAYSQSGWLHAKLLLIAILVAYHVHCGKLLKDFKHDRNRHGHVFYRWYNEFPVLILISVVILAVAKPF